jgi:hypothetical protein
MALCQLQHVLPLRASVANDHPDRNRVIAKIGAP